MALKVQTLWWKFKNFARLRRESQQHSFYHIHVAAPEKILIQNSFIFRIYATYKKISRAFGANIPELILLVELTIEKYFTRKKMENICSSKKFWLKKDM